MSFAFTKIIKAGDRQREFNFTKLSGVAVYHVDVNDDRGNRLLFKMAKDEQGQLTITEGGNELPNWVWDNTNTLSEAIRENFHS